MPYAFNDRGVAEELKRIANQSRGTTNHPRMAYGNEVILVKAPAEGIDAIDGSTITAGVCTKVYIDMSGVDPETAEDSSVEMSVLNTTSEDIGPDAIFQAARLGSVWVSVAGGGGGGKSVYQVVSTSSISAANGSLLGTGSGSRREISSNGTQLQSDGETVDIRNPWEESIESGSMMTCYHDSGYYVVIQASCPAALPEIP